jgi:uncharacterized protein YtpQ (UPF0354 family)
MPTWQKCYSFQPSAKLMSTPSLKTFLHRHSVYRLEYPAHWDALEEKDGESCGFGPHERDDVGLWISIMPMSVDTDRMVEDLPKLMQQSLSKSDAANMHRDTTLRHYGLVADISKEGEGGHYWIVAGGDVVLFASTQVPAAERDLWNPLFQQLMASLQITRDDHLLLRKVANDVMAELRRRNPDQEFEFENDTIRGPHQVVYLSNLFREVRSAPARREQIVKRFVATLSQPATAEIGHEQWDECHGRIVPVLKPRDYLHSEGPTQHLHVSEWLVDVVICYVIKSKKMFRFVTGWDLRRWGKDAATLHEVALANLARLPWPTELAGARFKDSGRLIIVDTDDSLASSRLLHPDLHKLFRGPLGSPFWAGIPCRNTLVVYSDRKALKARTARRLKKDHDRSAYPITPRPFLVTADGIAPAT